MKNKKSLNNACNKWYRDNKEIVVAVTCVFCDDIVPGRIGKKVCNDCSMKWGRKTPAKIMDTLTMHPSFTPMSKEILIWKRIVDYRNDGIYSFSKSSPMLMEGE